MTILVIIIIIIAEIFGVILAGAMIYALIIFHHEHRWAQIKSDKYKQFNQDNNEQEESADIEAEGGV